MRTRNRGDPLTCVAWDGKVLAADRLVSPYYSMGKIWRLPDGSLFSGCGDYNHMTEIAEWLQHGEKKTTKPVIEDNESTFIIITPDGACHWMSLPYLRPIKFLEPFVAIGSGSEFAMGAMAMGAGARKAVEVAARFDRATGKGVDALRLVPVKRKEKR